MSKHRVVFVRHGQSAFNKMRKLCGWHDTVLTDEGREQSRATGRLLKEQGYVFDLAFTSVLVRARDTLTEILTQMDCPHIEIRHAWQLNETHLGGWTGMTVKEFTDQFGEEKYREFHKGVDLEVPPMSREHEYYRSIVDLPIYQGQLEEDAFPTHETFTMHMQRSVAFWNAAIAPEIQKGKRVVVVSHKFTLKGLMKHLGQMTDQQIGPIEIRNATAFVYELDDNLKPVKPAEFLKT